MKWVRTFVDYAAALAFLGTVLLTRNFELATWVLVGASAGSRSASSRPCPCFQACWL